MPSDLLNVVGYVTGAILYAMLLVMAVRERSGVALTIAAALFGLVWNIGELVGYAAHAVDSSLVQPWLAALSFSALGYLPAVVIHSVARTAAPEPARRGRLARGVTAAAYAAAACAAALQIAAAARGAALPDPLALIVLTVALAALAPVLVLATRAQANARRAAWMTALAVFAVSALHLVNFHGARESWWMELLGHQASIPLAFAILYQDYRFALADLFLKQALTLVVVVGMVFGLWSLVSPGVSGTTTSPRAVGVLLFFWVASACAFPVIRRGVIALVDRVVLMRADAGRLLESLAADLQNAATEHEALDSTCRTLARALGAAVTWTRLDTPASPAPGGLIRITTAEPPRYGLEVGRLAGGRRLLSGDVSMLERAASILGHRIDAVRFTLERYERMLREREMSGLAAEAELRALRAQINPHFLFNALTTIGYLVREAPDRAVETLVRLTTLLRSAFRTDGEITTIRREVELIGCYLDIERERFEERLTVSMDVPDAIGDMAIPALLVQPLVENAVKHGIAQSRAGGHVAVQARIAPDRRLLISVRNTGAPLRQRISGPHGGVGLRNVERRLAAHYGEAACLRLFTDDDRATVAEIAMPVAPFQEIGEAHVTRHARA
jgi:hypothetical protein